MVPPPRCSLSLWRCSAHVVFYDGQTRDIRGKELELASLMHGRPAHERITAAEAEAKLEDQVRAQRPRRVILRSETQCD